MIYTLASFAIIGKRHHIFLFEKPFVEEFAGRKTILETAAMYVLQNSGHTTNLSVPFAKVSRKCHLISQLFVNLISALIHFKYYVVCKKYDYPVFILALTCIIPNFSDPGVHYPDFLGTCCSSSLQRSQTLAFPDSMNPMYVYSR